MKLFAYIVLPLVAAAQVPGRGTVRIEEATYAGSGCSQATVSVSLSPDADVLTITYDALNVYIGPGSTPADRTKTCAVDLAISSPDGAQFTIAEHTYHGYAALDEGLTKIMRFTYAFRTGAEPGSTAAVDSQVTIEGGGARARGEVFTTTQPVPEASWLWSPCGSSSTLATRERVTLQSRSAGASSGGDYANVPLVHQLRLRWRSCN